MNNNNGNKLVSCNTKLPPIKPQSHGITVVDGRLTVFPVSLDGSVPGAPSLHCSATGQHSPAGERDIDSYAKNLAVIATTVSDTNCRAMCLHTTEEVNNLI